MLDMPKYAFVFSLLLFYFFGLRRGWPSFAAFAYPA